MRQYTTTTLPEHYWEPGWEEEEDRIEQDYAAWLKKHSDGTDPDDEPLPFN